MAIRTGNTRTIYLAMAWLCLAVVVAGFFTTYLRPMWRSEFHAPAVVHVHGALLLGWTLLFLSQSWLARRRSLALHRAHGVLALVLVPGVVVSTIAIATYALRRDAEAGSAVVAAEFFLGNFTAPIEFAALVVAALVLRRKPETHKRLMLLATLVILWPAFFRLRHYFPNVPNPQVSFGFLLPQLLILAAMAHDRWRNGRIHPAYLWVGLPLIAATAFETLAFETGPWRAVSRWLASFFLDVPLG